MNKSFFTNNPLIRGMEKFKSSKKFGVSPGSVIYTGEKKVESVKLFITDFGVDSVERQEIESLQTLPEKTTEKRWLQINGLHDEEVLNQLGEKFAIHSLVLEDVVNPNQPPKVEEFDDYLFVITKIFHFDPEEQELKSEHLSFILLPDLIITFQETDTVHFDPILRRLDNPKGRMRKYGLDYFLYALLDLIIDFYFLALDAMNDMFEDLEERVIENPEQYHVHEIHQLKRQVITFRKSVRPLREVVKVMMDENTELISEDIDVFLRDLYDHTIQAVELLETQRELASGLMETYLSQVSHRMNEVMKVLTIMSTIFIPLGFLAGLYGMNFDYIPELHFRYGYFVLLGFMAVAVTGMLFVFKHKKWL
jgi:magnesium transporter